VGCSSASVLQRRRFFLAFKFKFQRENARWRSNQRSINQLHSTIACEMYVLVYPVRFQPCGAVGRIINAVESMPTFSLCLLVEVGLLVQCAQRDRRRVRGRRGSVEVDVTGVSCCVRIRFAVLLPLSSPLAASTAADALHCSGTSRRGGARPGWAGGSTGWARRWIALRPSAWPPFGRSVSAECSPAGRTQRRWLESRQPGQGRSVGDIMDEERVRGPPCRGLEPVCMVPAVWSSELSFALSAHRAMSSPLCPSQVWTRIRWAFESDARAQATH
jgi:hypothetical protein